MQARTHATFPPLSRVLERPLEALRKAGSYLAGELTGSYRPEKHYMRGPGPKWREKHAAGPDVQRRPDAARPGLPHGMPRLARWAGFASRPLYAAAREAARLFGVQR